ncbi:MAG: hypothetical protein HC804_04475, partial [Anaerolineae bacterium]|nr:hypothetical protein [Anaerolineae bacterium]
MTHTPLSLTEIQASLPAEWPDDLLPGIQKQVAAHGRTLVVLDDDPTGTQTVADVPVLTQWTVDALQAELAEQSSPVFYILTNSRSLPEGEAIALTAEIGRNLQAAAVAAGQEFALISRSDSTLRGHFPAELDALVTAVPLPFDAWLIIPFFLEGGRYTINDVHYVAEGDHLIPAAATPFAQDAAFGYQSSNLREWVAEKSNGRFPATTVSSISISQLRQGGP